jgi:DNA-directed RNA polymerase subunit RPC12/RpoP
MNIIKHDTGEHICPYCGYILLNETFTIKEIVYEFYKHDKINCPICKKEILL